LTFYEGNIVKIGYAISLVNSEIIIVTFYNDLFLNAKDGHRLSTEEISIFMLLLIKETRSDAHKYINGNFISKGMTEMPMPSAEVILDFVTERLNDEN
jgi:hypothetical protein